jgi:hypothetical protein
MMRSDVDAWTLTGRAINTSRKNTTNRRKWEREHGTHYGDGTGFVPDNTANTERDALLERVGDSLNDLLTDLERPLFNLVIQEFSFREIEKGTEARGHKVDRREISEIWRGIEEKLRAKLQASGVDPESSWRERIPHDPEFNPGGVMREMPKKNADEQAEQLGRSEFDDQDRIAQVAQWERNRTLDRDARQRRPATEAELQEIRDAVAAVKERRERAAGALSRHYREVEKIERGIKPRGRHASAERDEGQHNA